MTDDAAGRGELSAARPAAFLDRDGVINIDHGYVFRPEALAFTPTAIAAIRALNQSGYLVIVVTNQSGVARGLFGSSDVDQFHAHMQHQLAAGGARVDAFYYCPFHPDGTVPAFAREHEDRKPNPGMLLRAIRDWNIDPARSFMIGDKASDVEGAKRAGVHGVRVAANVCDLAAEVDRLLRRQAAEPAIDHATA